MPVLLDEMPFPDRPGEVDVHGQRVGVRANQIIVWVSLTLRRATSPNPAGVPFPAILDTGHSHSLSMQERHLNEWAGIGTEALMELGHIRVLDERIPLRAANIWIHSNVRGKRDCLADVSAHLIEAMAGIAVYSGGAFPRLPIQGLRAIAENHLVLKVDGRKSRATLRTPMRWWPLI